MKLMDALVPISKLHPASPAPPLRKPAAFWEEEGLLGGDGVEHLAFLHIPSSSRGGSQGELLFTSPGEQLRDGSVELMAILRMQGIFLDKK